MSAVYWSVLTIQQAYSQLGSQAPSQAPATKGIERQQNWVCVESVWCVSYDSTYSYAMHTKSKGSDWSVRGGIDTGPLVGDVQCSMAGDAGGAVCPARERDSCGTRYGFT